MSRRAVMVEVNRFLKQALPNSAVFMRDEQVALDDKGGCYSVQWGKEAQIGQSANLCPAARLMPCIVDCYGKDGEYADLMYEQLHDKLMDEAQFAACSVVRCEGEVLVSDQTQTDAVRAVVMFQFVA